MRLFEPTEFCGLSLKSRIAMAPMTRKFAPNGIVDPAAAAYYARRAQADVGLIITEGISPNLIGAQSNQVPHFDNDVSAQPWRAVVAGVHGAGSKIFAQLWHTGIRRETWNSAVPEQHSLGPARLYPELFPERSKEPNRRRGGLAMTTLQIRETIESFARAAQRAAGLGFDGVELHGAHGYLLDQFFWPVSNTRQDAYGGADENRWRIGLEIVQEIKRATRPDFVVGLRFSQWKLPDFYATEMFDGPKSLEEFLRGFVAAGIDYFHASTRRYWEPAFVGDSKSLAAWTKHLSGKPTIAVGSVGLQRPLSTEALAVGGGQDIDLKPLHDMLGRDEIDLIAVGRALLADSAWAAKLKRGEVDRIQEYSPSALSSLH